ncbi:undecaprenyl-phosphate glucose phosphotransferase [Endozoicomonas arenosclerae]|uniref:undecaprenyl-phosphate glucose phosphotransferase n=1 Tax=Endozoicomonas arenosclerae TaxID=1633495 RepID=UPI000785F0FE|nr:undecaprenyl-phosphate glucose phosphotransferase [Endozoicomonas arenosclerae]
MDANDGFIRPYQNQLSVMYRLIDGAVIYCMLVFISIFFGHPTGQQHAIAFLSIGIFWIIAESLTLYRSWRAHQFSELVFLTVSTWLMTCACVFTFAYFSDSLNNFPKQAMAYWSICSLGILIYWRLAFRLLLQFLRKRNYNTRSAIILCATETGKHLAREIKKHKETGIRLIGFYDERNPSRLDDDIELKGNIDDAVELAKSGNVDIVYVTLPMKAEERTHSIVDKLSNTTANVHIVPNFLIYNLLHSRWHCIGSTFTLSIYDTPAYGTNAFLKRLEDIILASLLLMICLIPMLLISLVIKLTSPGPVLFIQDRHGLDRRKIKVFKFRTMNVMENGPVIRQANKQDSRVTTVGRFLRSTSLDELPQLLNVLAGSMSLVGPRPHAVAHNEEYGSMIKSYMLRHKVKPGLTGLAQINGWRGETETIEKMQGRVLCDLEYINHWSLWLDLKIIFLTIIRGAFFHKNAY